MNGKKDASMKNIMKDRTGFTLVELLIALAITAFLSISIYGIYNVFYRQAKGQDLIIAAQQNARAGVERIQKELALLGYNVPSGTPAILQANANSIEFRYMDPLTGNRVDVTYAVSSNNTLTVKRCLEDSSWSGCPDPNIHPVIANINGPSGLLFSYFDNTGAPISAPVPTASLSSIQTIKVSLTTVTPQFVGAASSLTTKTAAVETEVRLRNYGVASAASNTTPPSQPTGLQSRLATAGSRFGVCGQLALRWTKGPESDLAGYIVYYTLGTYSNSVRVPLSQLAASGDYYYYTLAPKVSGAWDLQTEPSYGASGNYTYSVQVASYDNAYNTSTSSTAVSGTSTANDSFADAAVNGTTILASKPTPVTGLTAMASSSTPGAVTLGWAPYDTTTNPDIVGFRVYRSTQPFSAYPITPGGNVQLIATDPGLSFNTLGPAATSFTDNDPSLIGCEVYYYAIAPVNCDATLIPDSPSATTNVIQGPYAQTNYAATCGDGTDACTPGTGFASITGSRSAPYTTTPPNPPGGFSARAGWQRVALSFTQPSNTDFTQTCVYGNTGTTPPALQTDTTQYPLVGGCYQINTGLTPGAILLYENGGIFLNPPYVQNSSVSFWNNSLSGLTGTPSLANLSTYSYTAVAFDLCGLGSTPSSAQATTTLCGEDPPVCPQTDSTGYCQASPGKPPAPALPSAGTQPVSACDNPVMLTWTPVSSDLTQPSRAWNPYDLAGYRILRSPDNVNWTVLNAAAPVWGNAYEDAGLSDGTTYYYKIASTDCPYEKANPSPAQIVSDVNSGYLQSLALGPADPGFLDRDEMCVGSGSCTKTNHREVLTGVALNNSSGNGNNSATPSSTYTHDTVTLFFNNTSASTMTIQNLTLSWTNASAILSNVTVGGGRSGMGQYVTAVPSTQTAPVTGNAPYTAAVSGITLTSAQIPAGARYVPITFQFKDSSGNPVDERLDTLLITLGVQNDPTSTQNCLSYLTVSQVSQGVFVPNGPTAGGTVQNQPSASTAGYAVPGSAGLNTVPSGSNAPTVVAADLGVNISTSVTSTTLDEDTGTSMPISSVVLYYAVTANTVTAAPTSGYTPVTMTNASGNVWNGTAPANDGERIWYYVIATDADGNYARDPDISAGSYVYDQQSFNPCNVTPSAPAGLSATVSGTTASLSWNAVTTYTNGATVNSSDTIEYKIFRNGTQIGSAQSGTTYTDSGLTNNSIYNYTVEAINSCTNPGPMTSVASNDATACVGISGQANMTVTPTTIYRGQSYYVTIVDCYAASGTYATTVDTINGESAFMGFSNTASGSGDSISPTITETGPATGTFPITINTTGNSASNSSATATLYTNPSDTITVYYQHASPQTATVSVIVNPCANTPDAPTSLTGSVSNKTATISWSAVTLNTDGTSITDLAGYRIYENVCDSDGDDCTGYALYQSVGASTTSNSGIPIQSNKKYFFYVTAFDTCSPTPNESTQSSTWSH